MLGSLIIVSGCSLTQSQTEDKKDYAQLAEQLQQCDQLSDSPAVENCRNNIVNPLSDDEKEKLVDELQAIGYYPQP